MRGYKSSNPVCGCSCLDRLRACLHGRAHVLVQLRDVATVPAPRQVDHPPGSLTASEARSLLRTPR
jgi:hypothetical protein